MRQYLFITHITPVEKRSLLRQKLIEQYFRALEAQTYPHWKVVVLCSEPDRREGRFEYINLPELPGTERMELVKNIMNGERFSALAGEADYMIKLDDDDLISPDLLEKLADKDFDLYYDKFHTFYDISSGTITQQERPWIASTCVHKKEHLLSPWNGPGATNVGNLLYTNHAEAWHVYYKDKKKIVAPRNAPVYLRVLSPTSISSGARNTGKVLTYEDVSLDRYYAYLRSFGDWAPARVSGFEAYRSALGEAWQSFSGRPQQSLPAMSETFFNRVIARIRNRKPGA